MSRAEQATSIVAEMQRVADEARTNGGAAEDTLSALEDREARRATRNKTTGLADKFPALGDR